LGEMARLYRKVFRRPEPPNPYARIRLGRGDALGLSEPEDPDHLPHRPR
jgi:hypothetical protein